MYRSVYEAVSCSQLDHCTNFGSLDEFKRSHTCHQQRYGWIYLSKKAPQPLVVGRAAFVRLSVGRMLLGVGQKILFGKYLFILSKIYTIFCEIVIIVVYYSLPLFIFVTFILVRKYWYFGIKKVAVVIAKTLKYNRYENIAVLVYYY